MTESTAFREIMRMIERLHATRQARAAKPGPHGLPREPRKLRALIIAASAMVEISGCRDPDGMLHNTDRVLVDRLFVIAKVYEEREVVKLTRVYEGPTP